MNSFISTFAYKLIYVFRINDEAHKNLLKVGEATCVSSKSFEELVPNCKELNTSARNRINQYTTTAGIRYELLYTELAVYSIANNGQTFIKAFSDHDVHKVLERSGINRYYFDTQHKANEWFKTDLETIKKAITAVKEGRTSLTLKEISYDRSPIVFRPEQLEAIKLTKDKFKIGDRMLWNAKMRFGKTLTALQVAKEMGFSKTIILTHRPVVSDGWYDDFGKIFYDTDYIFGSKTKGKGEKIENLINTDKKFVYFASMQDLRGSSVVGGKFNKNEYVFQVDWDYVVIDEAHEGTQTRLGTSVIEELCSHSKKPKVLRLSGTPFNLLDQFKEDEIYTWDYVMEQRAKKNWDLLHFGDTNPYASLPELQIFTYDLNKLISGYFDEEEQAFNFREFFRTWTGEVEKDFKPIPLGCKVGDFIHEDDVNAFLNLLCKKDNQSNYPFSTDEYRNYFRHSLWMVPGVKEAKALTSLLHKHKVFGSGAFKIVNVAGAGDEEIDANNALDAVRNAFGPNPAETYTITISCGRLTTGVTVPEWTAVFMLSGTVSTSASSYLQTIFRVQTPANINGQVKERCCVFDFAPDRTLKMVAQARKLSSRAGDVSTDRVIMGEFLNFCPVISIEGSKMQEFNVDSLLQQLKRAYTERVVRNGFDDPHIYNDNLLKLDNLELGEFAKLKEIIGVSKQTTTQKDIDINNQGLTNEQYQELKRIESKPKKELTEEEKRKLEEAKEKRKNRDTAISILRGISIRIPLLVYGADVTDDTEITTDNFTEIVDDDSWKEFMPTGVDKDTFKKFARYYEQDVFISAGRQIRNKAKYADSLSPFERVKKIAEIFNTFKNPDKETVLTPWRVVNKHLAECFGGYCFYDKDFVYLLDKPRYVECGNAQNNIFNNIDSRILEVNSKTGLYPLYVVYSLYANRLNRLPENERTIENQLLIWDKVVEENIFVVCKTPMARLITKRTLLGYRNGKINAHAFDNLVMQLKDKPEQFKNKILRGEFWNKENKVMKFDAVVGNPPYQESKGGTKNIDIWQYFIFSSLKLANCVSLIHPGRWLVPKKQMGPIHKQMIDSGLVYFDYYPDATKIFSNVSIDGGVTITYFNDGYDGDIKYYNNGMYYGIFDSNNTFISNKFEEEIYSKINPSLFGGKTMNSRIVGNIGSLGGGEFGYKKALHINYLKETDNRMKNPIKIWANNGFGKGARFSWFYIEKDVLSSIPAKLLGTRKVMIDKKGHAITGGKGNIINNIPQIVDKLSLASGDVLFVIPENDTDYELELIKSLFMTKTARFLMSITQKDLYVRGFENIPDYTYFIKDLNQGLFTDEFFYKKFNFSKDLIEYINSKISNK